MKRLAGLPNTLLPQYGYVSGDPDFFNLKAAKNESIGPVLDVTVDSTSGFYNADTNFLGTSAMQSPLMETVQEEEAE